ncbi:hypothetical protein SAMN05444166_7327 [Singulisphaera sp. GP187]|nr:hypothetical protein SAMN05444166_7327 [Singulisphaera sp. GP187]
MTQPRPSNPGNQPRLPSRRTGTPPGYGNVRVLVPTGLHYRVISHSGISHLTVPEFALSGSPVPAPWIPSRDIRSARTTLQGHRARTLTPAPAICLFQRATARHKASPMGRAKPTGPAQFGLPGLRSRHLLRGAQTPPCPGRHRTCNPTRQARDEVGPRTEQGACRWLTTSLPRIIVLSPSDVTPSIGKVRILTRSSSKEPSPGNDASRGVAGS